MRAPIDFWGRVDGTNWDSVHTQNEEENASLR